MDEQKITADLLLKVMSWISEERWCAGWLRNLEYILWDEVTGKRKDICSPEEIDELKYLSEKCGGWIIWDEQQKVKGLCRCRTGYDCMRPSARKMNEGRWHPSQKNKHLALNVAEFAYRLRRFADRNPSG